jgi:transposase
MVVRRRRITSGEPSTCKIPRSGVDIAKNVFQVRGIDAAEKVIARKQLRRGQVLAFFEALAPCLIGMEACATSHRWLGESTFLGVEDVQGQL